MVLYSRFVLVPFNSQTAMCKSLSPFFYILTLNSSCLHGFCGKPIIIFRLHSPLDFCQIAQLTDNDCLQFFSWFRSPLIRRDLFFSGSTEPPVVFLDYVIFSP